ncbi:uncharacterized protein LOC129598356 isoform X2 [Paramacrobiotus metropolitanus]|uniref:uncharacterized protein LOC129598356 isoform X2 n=1 Tax=Paramacrobiotus metropolitanus TaxID=2943436 RepID=UPI002445DEF0|nr:uncharacterized protein LOC129598356 isoform X2 [Paramacrobiotus metropolitanus]
MHGGEIRVNDMLVEAWQSNRQDDRITLARLAPSPDVADSVTYRPRLGKNVTFNCSVPADVDWRDVSWLHQDRTVYEAGRPVETSQDTTGQSYNFTRVNSTLFFSVLNVSTCVGGAVLCVATPSVPSNYSPRPRVLQRYQLLPLITRSSDVFAAPNASYITASEGDDVMVPCWIRLPLPEAILRNMRNHFMVRHNGRIVRGPPEAPYGPLLPASVPSNPCRTP